MSDTKSRFIYKVTTNAASYVVIAHAVQDARNIVSGRPENATVMKLGCVTDDVFQREGRGVGIVCREWLPIK